MPRTQPQKNRVSYHIVGNFKPFPTIKENKVLKASKEEWSEKPVETQGQSSKMTHEITNEITKQTPICLPRIIYAAAQNLLRSYPIHVPILIYQFHSNISYTGYDVFMEKTDKGWKEWVNTYPVYTTLENNFYLMEGLALAVQQELEMTEILPAIMSQADWIHRLMDS